MKRLFSKSVLIARLTFYLAWLCIVSCHQSTAPEGFQIEPGFTLQRVAAEPLIRDPVSLAFNEQGDALVLEMPGYPFEDSQSRIVVLKDKDKDGVFDDKIVFAENLQLATSFMLYKKGVLVAAPPYLLYVQDSDQDYKPEKVDTLMGGFATGNLQHNYNGIQFGLDNWIYAANGGNDGMPYWWNDTTTRINLQGQDFRFNLETRALERLGNSAGGFGLAADEYGRFFETNNTEHISHLVFADRYLKGRQILPEQTRENISSYDENGLARIYPVGEQETRLNHPEQSGYFSGACGITWYGGGALGTDYDNTVWTADVVLNLVHVDKIAAKEASFSAVRQLEKREIIASTDRSFRPVNMAVGPDGAMYVVDMYRKVIEHPEWIPDEIEKTLDLQAGKEQGRIYRIAKKGSNNSFDFSVFKTGEGLVKSLSDPNQWVRNTAQRLLLDKTLSKETIALLKSQLTSENPYAKLHSLWILNSKAALEDDAIIAALHDAMPGMRENALLIAEARLNSKPLLLDACLNAVTDSNARVRMQAALSLSTIAAGKLNEIKQRLFANVQASANNLGDRWNIAAITLSVGDDADELLETLLNDPSQTASVELMESLALASSKTQHGLETVLAALVKSSLPGAARQQILHQLSAGSAIKSNEAISSSIKMLETGDPASVTELAVLRSKLGMPPSNQFVTMSRQALSTVIDRSLKDSTRLQGLAMIGLLPYKEKSKVLFACLSNTEPIKIQEDALRQLSTYDDKEIGQKLVAMWKDLSPHIRKYAGDLLLYIEAQNDALLTGLENGTINIGEMNFDLERRRTLLWWTEDKDIRRRAEKLFSDVGVTNRQVAIDKMKPALTLPGLAANGVKVFETICASCHLYGKIGNEVGPVLTEIGRKSKETLMHEILDPNSAADTKYINHLIETKNGAVHTGIVAAETDQYITLKKMGGETVTISKADIKSFRSLGSSLMMEGLENSISQQEMADLLAFLQK